VHSKDKLDSLFATQDSSCAWPEVMDGNLESVDAKGIIFLNNKKNEKKMLRYYFSLRFLSN
jgi:hypothetical protein